MANLQNSTSIKPAAIVRQLPCINLNPPPTGRQIHLDISIIITSTYPKKYKKDINLEIQDIDIDPINTKQQDLNGFLVYCIVHYTDSKYNNIILQYYIKEDFVKWIKEIQAPIKKDIIQDFYNFLQENRVFIPINRGNIGDNIQEYIINIKEEHK